MISFLLNKVCWFLNKVRKGEKDRTIAFNFTFLIVFTTAFDFLCFYHQWLWLRPHVFVTFWLQFFSLWVMV